jgi:hypothetical protein
VVRGQRTAGRDHVLPARGRGAPPAPAACCAPSHQVRAGRVARLASTVKPLAWSRFARPAFLRGRGGGVAPRRLVPARRRSGEQDLLDRRRRATPTRREVPVRRGRRRGDGPLPRLRGGAVPARPTAGWSTWNGRPRARTSVARRRPARCPRSPSGRTGDLDLAGLDHGVRHRRSPASAGCVVARYRVRNTRCPRRAPSTRSTWRMRPFQVNPPSQFAQHGRAALAPIQEPGAVGRPRRVPRRRARTRAIVSLTTRAMPLRRRHLRAGGDVVADHLRHGNGCRAARSAT